MPGELPVRSAPVWKIADQRSDENGLTITTYAKKTTRYDVVSSGNRFVDIAFNRFDLKQVCAILLNGNPSFSGHKDALAAALCGWMLGSGEGGVFRRRSVALSVATTLARAERTTAKESLHEQLTTVRYPRKSNLPPAFFAELYYPIGGFKYIVRTPARYGLRYEMQGLRNRLYLINMMAAIDHLHAQLSSTNPKLADVSLARSSDLLRMIESAMYSARIPNYDNIRTEYVSKFEKSLPLLYAASTIKYSEAESVLDAVARANWSSVLKPGILHELLGRALYYTETIYAKNLAIHGRTSTVKSLLSALGGIQAKPFDPPDRVRNHSKLIEYYYSDEGYKAYKHPDKTIFWSAVGLPVPKVIKGAKGGRSQPTETR